ncbi:unnamed protein product [Rhodiola kirilowii]
MGSVDPNSEIRLSQASLSEGHSRLNCLQTFYVVSLITREGETPGN